MRSHEIEKLRHVKEIVTNLFHLPFHLHCKQRKRTGLLAQRATECRRRRWRQKFRSIPRALPLPASNSAARHTFNTGRGHDDDVFVRVGSSQYCPSAPSCVCTRRWRTYLCNTSLLSRRSSPMKSGNTSHRALFRWYGRRGRFVTRRSVQTLPMFPVDGSLYNFGQSGGKWCSKKVP